MMPRKIHGFAIAPPEFRGGSVLIVRCQSLFGEAIAGCWACCQRSCPARGCARCSRIRSPTCRPSGSHEIASSAGRVFDAHPVAVVLLRRRARGARSGCNDEADDLVRSVVIVPVSERVRGASLAARLTAVQEQAGEEEQSCEDAGEWQEAVGAVGRRLDRAPRTRRTPRVRGPGAAARNTCTTDWLFSRHESATCAR